MSAPADGKSLPATTAPIIVTRPEADALLWVAQLQRQGLKAEALPLIDIVPVAELSALAAVWQDLGACAAVMFVSGNAVTHFFAARPAGDLAAALPAHVRFMAPGPGTARALRAAGVPALQIDSPPADAAQFDSEALWALIGQRPWRGQRVLIVRGQSAGDSAATGRDWLARQWEAAGAGVALVSVYERRAPVFTLAQRQRMDASQTDGSIWLFSSSEALAHLPLTPLGRWRQGRAIATHPRIAEAARGAGWGVVIESRPALADILASIESLHP